MFSKLSEKIVSCMTDMISYKSQNLEYQDEELTKLNINQLKSSYLLFSNTEFSGSEYSIKCFKNIKEPEYFLIKNEIDNTSRLLFYPVTVFEDEEPSAHDLSTILSFVIKKTMQYNDISQIIIPIGEKTKINGLVKGLLNLTTPGNPSNSINHMVTLVIESAHNLPMNFGSVVNVKIIDSFARSLPYCQQTKAISSIIKSYFNVIDFDRIYLGHQSILDWQSCCFFTLKVVKTVISSRLLKSSDFKTIIPQPTSFLLTSDNWLTKKDYSLIKRNIINFFNENSPSIDEVKKIEDLIVEVE